MRVLAHGILGWDQGLGEARLEEKKFAREGRSWEPLSQTPSLPFRAWVTGIVPNPGGRGQAGGGATYMVQNDPHVAPIILIVHVLGQSFFEKKNFLPAPKYFSGNHSPATQALFPPSPLCQGEVRSSLVGLITE